LNALEPALLRIVMSGLVCGCLTACGGGGGNGRANDNGPRTDYHGIAIADMDGDGWSDIVAARAFFDPEGPDENSVEVFLRDSVAPNTFLAPVSYTLEQVPYHVTAVDLDDDGDMDVLVSCTLEESGFRMMLQTGNGGGELGPSELIAAAGPVHETATADIDLDGLPDVVAATDTLLILFTQKTAVPGTFNEPVTIGEGSQRIALEDLDDDALIDVVAPRNVAGGSPGTVFYLQDAAVPGTFLPLRGLLANHAVHDVAAADLDGDGVMDLGVAGATTGVELNGEWSLFLQDPRRLDGFDLAHDYDLRGSFFTLIAVGDLDQNGSPDVALGQRTRDGDGPNTLDVFLHDVADRFVRDARYVIPDDLAVTLPNMYEILIADLNDDRLPDIVISTNEIFYFPQRVDAPGKFGAAIRIAAQR
jgi:FG-GAP-like repeat